MKPEELQAIQNRMRERTQNVVEKTEKGGKRNEKDRRDQGGY